MTRRTTIVHGGGWRSAGQALRTCETARATAGSTHAFRCRHDERGRIDHQADPAVVAPRKQLVSRSSAGGSRMMGKESKVQAGTRGDDDRIGHSLHHTKTER